MPRFAQTDMMSFQPVFLGDLIAVFLLIGTFFRLPISFGSFSGTIVFSDIFMFLWALFFLIPHRRPNERLVRNSEIFMIMLFLFLIIELVVHQPSLGSAFYTAKCVFSSFFVISLGSIFAFNTKTLVCVLSVYDIWLLFIYLTRFLLDYKIGENIEILSQSSTNYAVSLLLILTVFLMYVVEASLFKGAFARYMLISIVIVNVLGILISGSRIAVGLLGTLLLTHLFSSIRSLLSFARFLVLIALVLLLVFASLYLNPDIGFRIERFSVFLEQGEMRKDIVGSDALRFGLWETSVERVGDSLLFGHGSPYLTVSFRTVIPPHNFILEILLAFGLIGLALYILGTILTVGAVLYDARHTPREWRAFLQLLVVFFGIAFFHPFVSTGNEFNILFGLVVLNFYSLTRNKELSKKHESDA